MDDFVFDDDDEASEADTVILEDYVQEPVVYRPNSTATADNIASATAADFTWLLIPAETLQLLPDEPTVVVQIYNFYHNTPLVTVHLALVPGTGVMFRDPAPPANVDEWGYVVSLPDTNGEAMPFRNHRDSMWYLDQYLRITDATFARNNRTRGRLRIDGIIGDQALYILRRYAIDEYEAGRMSRAMRTAEGRQLVADLAPEYDAVERQMHTGYIMPVRRPDVRMTMFSTSTPSAPSWAISASGFARPACPSGLATSTKNCGRRVRRTVHLPCV